MPSPHWDVHGNLLKACIAYAGLYLDHGPVQTAVNLRALRGSDPFRQRISGMLHMNPAALMDELRSTIGHLMQVVIAYECEGQEDKYATVLNDVADKMIADTVASAKEKAASKALVRKLAVALARVKKSKVSAKAKAKAKAKVQAKSRPLAKAKAKVKASARKARGT